MIKAVVFFILLMLKIVGALLLIGLFLLALLLLVPVRYSINAQNSRTENPQSLIETETDGKKGTLQIKLQVNFSWLLHLIHVSFHYGKDGFSQTIRVFGVDVQKITKRFRKQKSGNQQTDETSEAAKDPGNDEIDAENGDFKEQNFNEKASHGENANGAFNEKALHDGNANEKFHEKTSNDENLNEKVLNKVSNDESLNEKTSNENSIKNLQDKNLAAQKTRGKNKTGNTETENNKKRKSKKQGNTETKKQKTKKQKTKKQGNTVAKKQHTKKQHTKTENTKISSKKTRGKKQNASRKKTGRIRSFHREFTDAGNRQALAHLWQEILFLLRHYKPNKIKADLAFSLADPALTGYALGILSMNSFVYKYPCQISPDFTAEDIYVEGEIFAKGKITVLVFLISLLRLWRDKEFIHAFNKVSGRG